VKKDRMGNFDSEFGHGVVRALPNVMKKRRDDSVRVFKFHLGLLSFKKACPSNAI
jgi:hypothetical protein